MIGRGNADASRLYLRVSGAGQDKQMPPDGPLSAEQISIVKRWIDQRRLAGRAVRRDVTAAG